MAKQTTTQAFTNSDSDFAALQLKESLETLRTQVNLLIQILSGFIFLNVTIMGFAVTNKLAGLFFVGALIPLAMIFIIQGALKWIVPILYTSVSLEKKYGVQDADYLVSTFLAFIISEDFHKILQQVRLIKNHDERVHTFGKEASKLVNLTRLRVVMYVVAWAEAMVAIQLKAGFHWNFF
jgi:hypothetical protein